MAKAWSMLSMLRLPCITAIPLHSVVPRFRWRSYGRAAEIAILLAATILAARRTYPAGRKGRSQSRDRSPVQDFGRFALKHLVSSIPPGAKVEAESLLEAALRGLYRSDSSFWTEHDVFDRMDITVEVREEPITHTVRIEKVNKSHGRHPPEEAKKAARRKLLFESVDETN